MTIVEKDNQPDGRYRSIGYNLEVRLLYPLLSNEMFINLVNHHQFDGNVILVKEFIENNSSMCNYDELCELLDSIYNGNKRYQLEVKNNNLGFIYKHIDNINRLKSIVIDIKENITREIFDDKQDIENDSVSPILAKKISNKQ